MKRFYKKVTVANEAEGCGVLLDGKPVRTPLRKILLLPHEKLAAKVAADSASAAVNPRWRKA